MQFYSAGSSGVFYLVEIDGVAGGKRWLLGGMGLVHTLKRLMKEYGQIFCPPKTERPLRAQFSPFFCCSRAGVFNTVLCHFIICRSET